MADQMPNEGKREGTGRFMRILLIISLAFNLAVVGLVAGVALKGWRDGPRAHSVRELGFGFFTSALEDDDRRALRQAFADRAPDLRAARRGMRQDLEALLTTIRAEPFSSEAFRGVLDRGAQRATERRALGEELIVNHLSGMDAEARAAFADRLEKGLKRRVGRGKDRQELRDDR
ncbi:MAG: periplasmic heavy metal sensor [Pseudorhodobacter sp.]